VRWPAPVSSGQGRRRWLILGVIGLAGFAGLSAIGGASVNFAMLITGR
jgi:hypothetical protein